MLYILHVECVKAGHIEFSLSSKNVQVHVLQIKENMHHQLGRVLFNWQFMHFEFCYGYPTDYFKAKLGVSSTTKIRHKFRSGSDSRKFN